MSNTISRERLEQLESLRSELAEIEKRYAFWMNEAQRPRFSRRFSSLEEQKARHKAARLGERCIELRDQITALEGADSEAA